MIRHAAHQLAVHSPRVTGLACHWLPFAVAAGIIAGAPANLVEIPGMSMPPRSTPVSAGGTPSNDSFDEGEALGAASGIGGSGFFQAGALTPMETGTWTIAATAPEAALVNFLLPLYDAPVELMPATLPAAMSRAGAAPLAEPMLDRTVPADLPAMPFDRLGPVAPARPAVSSPVTVAEVPEPSTAFLLSGGALALLLLRRRNGRVLRRWMTFLPLGSIGLAADRSGTAEGLAKRNTL